MQKNEEYGKSPYTVVLTPSNNSTPIKYVLPPKGREISDNVSATSYKSVEIFDNTNNKRVMLCKIGGDTNHNSVAVYVYKAKCDVIYGN